LRARIPNAPWSDAGVKPTSAHLRPFRTTFVERRTTGTRAHSLPAGRQTISR
jgi:hypothetical protein